MNCEEFKKLIIRFETDDDFDEELGQEFRQHYLTCNDCWDRYESYLKLLAAFQSQEISRYLEEEPEPDRVDELLEYADAFQEIDELEEAIECLKEAVELKPREKTIEEKLDQIQNSLHERKHLSKESKDFSLKNIRKIAYEFVKKYYPKELDIFDLAWRIFRDITPQDFKQEEVSGALGIVGKPDLSELITPKLIILLTNLSQEEIVLMSQGELTDSMLLTAKRVGCSKDFMKRIREFLLTVRQE